MAKSSSTSTGSSSIEEDELQEGHGVIVGRSYIAVKQRTGESSVAGEALIQEIRMSTSLEVAVHVF